MDFNEFELLLEKAKLKKGQFAELVGMNTNSVSNWCSSNKIPPWVKSWLENYIKAKNYADIKRKIFDIENIHELAIEKIFNETNDNYNEQAVYIYRDTLDIQKTIKMINIASSISRDAHFLTKCSDSDIDTLYEYLKAKNFKATKEDENLIVDCMNGHGLKGYKNRYENHKINHM